MKRNVLFNPRFINIMLAISAFLLFFSSVFFFCSFIRFSPISETEISSPPAADEYSKLIAGNYSGNLAQYTSSTISDARFYGQTCCWGSSLYYYQERQGESFLCKAPIATPSSGIPILKGYTISYINATDNKLFFIGNDNSEETAMSKIYSINIDGSDFSEVKINDQKQNVTSLVSNNNLIYFTLENDAKIYCTNTNSTDFIDTLFTFPSNHETVKLFGADKDNIYYITDDNIGKIDIIEKVNKKISVECCSIFQSPILIDKGILFLSDLTKPDLMFIPHSGDPIKIVSKDIISSMSNASLQYVNYSSGFIFLSIDNKIYYFNTQDKTPTLKELQGMPTFDGRIILTNEYCISPTEKGDYISQNINWLLAQ